jgi:hypothetical protein
METTTTNRQEEEESYFGVCPVCLHTDGPLFDGEILWYICEEDRLKWYVGNGKFTGEKNETWERNAQELADFEETTQHRPTDRTCDCLRCVRPPLGELVRQALAEIKGQR